VNVRYQDRWLLVVDKPAGLPTQAARTPGENLFDTLRATFPYVGLHHRLDTAASGLVLFTLDRTANRAVALGFQQHTIVRTYLAVAVGEVLAAHWVRPVDGAPAETRVEIVGTGPGLTALRLFPQTGRKHQLRIHAALAGCPLAGDRTHGGDTARTWPRLALHAARLQLRHPVEDRHLDLHSPMPPDLDALWTKATTHPPAGRGPG
jgi:23S rRNA-/tRNA-specific pseudouridylate synthase